MLDCLIIGSGLAGISASLTMKANGMDFALVGEKKLSGKIRKAEKISNYPGLVGISGEDFSRALSEQLEKENIVVEEERVVGVYAMTGYFTCLCESGKSYESKTVILATGVETTGKTQGEEAFTGRGVSYCATCDGMLYKNKTIAIVITSERFEEETEFLTKLAKKTYLVPLYKNPRTNYENTEIIVKAPVAVEGGLKAERLRFKDSEIAVDGIFMLKESLPPSSLVGGLETADGKVKTDRNCATNLPGLFEAGDITGRPYQYAKAAGEGNVAAHAAIEFIRKNGK